jgi:hypothetical protein
VNCLEPNENVIACLACVAGVRNEATCISYNQGPWQDNQYLEVFGEGNKSFEGLFHLLRRIIPIFRLPELLLHTWSGQIELVFEEEAFLVFRERIIMAHCCCI